MSTSFAAQLRNIAANSTHELDLRARKTAHAESLLFPKDVAVKQDWETIYTVCIEGFHELCQLEPRFHDFDRNLFSPQSQDQDREMMNKSENEALDHVLSRCLGMLGARVLLRPGLRAVEWLVRRFRVHVYNTASLLLTFLPYHEMPVWRNVLSIIPVRNLVAEWKFLMPYHKDAGIVPRHVIMYAATNNDGFFSILNRYVLDVSRDGSAYSTLLRFWGSVITEATVDRLAAARSGRKEVQRQRTEDALLKILPILSDGFEIKGCEELTTSCFTLAMVVAAKADLGDQVLDSLLEAVAIATRSSEVDFQAAIVTMAVVVSRKQEFIMPKRAMDTLVDMPHVEAIFQAMGASSPVTIFAESVVNGALRSMKKRNISVRLAFTEKVLRYAGTQPQQTMFKKAVQAAIGRLSQFDTSDSFQDLSRARLVDILRRLSEDSEISHRFAEAVQDIAQGTEQLELLIGATIASVEAPSNAEGDFMAIDVPPSQETSIEQLLEKIPSRTADTASYLAHFDVDLYDQLITCFNACCKYDRAVASFVNLAIWSSATSSSLLLCSFLLRAGVTAGLSRQRSTALRALGLQLEQMEIDAQVVLPYALTALTDESQNVRRSAGGVIIAMAKAMERVEGERFGANELYRKEAMDELVWVPTNHVLGILRQVFIPALEECVLDASQVGKLVGAALNGPIESQAGPKTGQLDIKKSLRHSLFDLITSHAVATPILRVKVTSVLLLKDVHKVGSTTKSRALSPVLKAWASLSQDSAQAAVAAEKINLAETDETMMQLITAQDKEATGRILTMFEEGKVKPRPDLIPKFFERVQRLWEDLKYETQVSSAIKMFEFSFSENAAVQRGAQSTLHAVRLTTEILGSILQQSTNGMAEMQNDDHQPRKKRRTSHGRDSLPPQLAGAMDSAASRLTLALELLDDSTSESHPELMTILFDLLATIKRLKQQQRLDSPYLLNLCLSSILAMVNGRKSESKPNIDMTSVRADLVTDCIRGSENPQVQKTALLLAASLASLAPDRMLHNVMPIFTFMGQSMLSKEDEQSILVVNQAIDQIIPALVHSLKKNHQDMIKSTSSLLSSFAAAFDHIPQHRRVAMYQRVLKRMGIEEFACNLIAMIALRKSSKQTYLPFLGDLLAEFSALSQLTTYRKLVALSDDVLADEPRFAVEVLEVNQSTSVSEKQRISKIVSQAALVVLKSKNLKAQTKKMHKLTTDDVDLLRTEFINCLSSILSSITRRNRSSQDVEDAKESVGALLSLPSLAELFIMTPQMLEEMSNEPDLQPQALRIVASQIDQNLPKDSRTRTSAMRLLDKLTALITPAISNAMKQAIIICIDRISEAYGRKDQETILAAANIVCGPECIGSDDRQVTIMSMLCLASILEVLKEGCTPIVPSMLPKVIEISQKAVKDEDEEIHNAALALISSTIIQVPFLVSERDLHDMLLQSSLSAAVFNTTTAIESRLDALSTIGTKIDLDSLLEALLTHDLHSVRVDQTESELEQLDLLSTAIVAGTKTQVVRSADLISQLLLVHLDQRRKLVGDKDENYEGAITGIEDKVGKVSIQFIYKLNDTVFRPIFESWIDWAIRTQDIVMPPLDTSGAAALRQTSLFSILNHFFDTLKSIVTSYASYLIQPASAILEEIATSLKSHQKFTMTPHLQNRYVNLLTLLTSMLTHDADGFFATPAHFTPIGPSLIEQLNLASSKSNLQLVNSHIVPTIIALATATLDTPIHHQTLTHHIVQLRHSPSAAVRLASIKILAALSVDEAVGDDWIANTIGVGSTAAADGDAVGIATGGGSSAGEVMIYVNEMLEDDSEDVEMEVRRWVQTVREKVGEDVFEV